MRASEFTLSDDMPHLYLDIDGVQADFFGAWSKYHGVTHYKQIKNKEGEIEKLANSSDEDVYNFFRKLKPLSGGMRVVKWLKQNRIPFTVLSAPLHGPHSEASIQAKLDWLDQYNPGTSQNAIFTSEKYRYATRNGIPNVLVDDFGKYLQAWENAGGIAIKHEDEHSIDDDGQKTIDELQKIYDKYINKSE